VAEVPCAEPLVLVVDDDGDMRTYICQCLRPLTSRVLEAADGLEALSLAALHEDLVLVIADVVMPRLDGRALAERLRHTPALAGLPVLFVTGSAGPAQDQRGPVLRKPFSAATLRAHVGPLLGPEYSRA
jgi:CheY-like chemotaxis protein